MRMGSVGLGSESQESPVLRSTDMAEQLKREKLQEEFEVIRSLDEHRRLIPERAVEWAEANPESVLHAQLEWDDDEAAKQYRIQQVRQLIQVVVVQSEERDRVVRAYLSVPSDRVHGGGYRTVNAALAGYRQELINEALNDINRLRGRYLHLPELDGLFTEIRAAVDRFRAGATQFEAG